MMASAACSEGRVAVGLQREVAHYREQAAYFRSVAEICGAIAGHYDALAETVEAHDGGRRRDADRPPAPLPAPPPGASPFRAASPGPPRRSTS